MSVGTIAFVIALPRDYMSRAVLRYMSRDAASLTERCIDHGFAKSMLLDGKPSVIEVTIDGREARCVVTGARSKRAMAVAQDAVLRMLGLPFSPSRFERTVLSDARLSTLVAMRRGLRVPRTATVFEALVWAIVGQQVNLTFAYKLRNVVIELAGKRAGSMRAHPDAAAVANLDYADLTSRQYSRRKAEYLIDTARLVATGELDPEALPFEPPAAVEERILSIRGFGPWSAHYVMMRGCGFPDCVPLGDTGLTSSLQDFFQLDVRPDRETTLALMAPFAPFRSLATLHFWMRLSEGAM